MITFLRHLKVASFIILVTTLSMMTACTSEEPVSNLSPSYMQVNLYQAAPVGILECTVYVVNTGSATEVEVTAEFLRQMNYIPDSEWASTGKARIDLEEGIVYWDGDVPADDQVAFGFQAIVVSLAAGQPVFGEVLIYDTVTDGQYNLDEATSFCPDREYAYDGLGMIESFTHYEYDATGNLISGETTNLDKQGAPIGGATTEYEYNSLGNLISEETTNSGEQGVPAGGAIVEYEYDSLNRLITMETTDLDKQGAITRGARTEFEYNDLGNIVSEEMINLDEEELKTESTVTEYERDEQGRITKVTVSNYDENDVLTGSTVTEYDYDNQGRVKKVSVDNYDGDNVLTGGTLTEYGYDYEGRVKWVDVSNYDEDSVITGGTLTEYGYDDEGRVKWKDVSNYDEDSVITGGTLTEYEYDEQGRVTKVEVSNYDEDSVITGTTVTEYEYDEHDRVTKVTVSTFDESDTLMSRKVTEYKYDGQGRINEVSSQISDPVGDLYGSGGAPASGLDWQDITEVDVLRTGETITFTLTSLGWMLDEDFVDGAFMVLVDIDGDGEVEPAEGGIDFYGGNLDYGIFMPSPEFGEPPIFIEDLQLHGEGGYDTTGVQYSIEGNKIEIEVELDHIGNPEGTISFVGAIRTGIISEPIEDRVPNEGLAKVEDP